MTFDDIAVSNIFLACITFLNLAILAILYHTLRNK
jgi:hypothetical protein